MLRPIQTLLAILLLATTASAQPAYKYFRTGSPQDITTKTQPGYALMGGGSDLDEAFRWLCNRAHGGDFLILRAAGTDAYNPYVQPLCKLNSVATLVLPSREAANDPFVATTIRHAEAIFIAGGDQANYIRNWTGTPVQTELNAAIQRGIPLGGTSAGLAVMGEWAYTAEADKPDDPNLDSKTALNDPFGPRITLAHNFLEIPILKGVITDTHFAKRDRMGRLLVFLARLSKESRRSGSKYPIRGLGVEDKAAVLMERNGAATVIGNGAAYLVEPAKSLASPVPGAPLTTGPFLIHKIMAGQRFDLLNAGQFGDYYQLSVTSGEIKSDLANNLVY